MKPQTTQCTYHIYGTVGALKCGFIMTYTCICMYIKLLITLENVQLLITKINDNYFVTFIISIIYYLNMCVTCHVIAIMY